jgi:hypothetical protein
MCSHWVPEALKYSSLCVPQNVPKIPCFYLICFVQSWTFISIYEVRLFVCLSCWNLPNHGKSCHALWILEKPSISRDKLSWFPPMVKKLLNIEQLHTPHPIFRSSKRLVQMFGSCVTIPTKKCELGKSPKPDPRPLFNTENWKPDTLTTLEQTPGALSRQFFRFIIMVVL